MEHRLDRVLDGSLEGGEEGVRVGLVSEVGETEMPLVQRAPEAAELCVSGLALELWRVKHAIDDRQLLSLRLGAGLAGFPHLPLALLGLENLDADVCIFEGVDEDGSKEGHHQVPGGGAGMRGDRA
jgi:hypothetical protein